MKFYFLVLILLGSISNTFSKELISKSLFNISIDDIKQCSKYDQEISDSIIDQMKSYLKEPNLSKGTKDLIKLYERLSEQNWKRLKQKCPLSAFNLYMLSALQKDNFFSILTTKGFPLGESHQFELNETHKIIFQNYTGRIIKKYECTLPRIGTRIDYNTLSILREITSHPQFPRHEMQTINTCVKSVNKKLSKYNRFKNDQTCYGLSYFINGNLEGTQKGKWIEKDLFCEGYRSYQVLRLISKNPDFLISQDSLDIITSQNLFKSNKLNHSCQLYFYHSKRQSCYPSE